MNLNLCDDLSAIDRVINEARTISNMICKYLDDLGYLKEEQINPEYIERLKGYREFSFDDDVAVSSMAKSIGRLLVIVSDSISEVSGVLYKFPDREQLESVVFDKLYRGI